MSFLGGAECSTAGNPLNRLKSVVESDKTHLDRVGGVGPVGGNFRTAPSPASQDASMNGFLNSQPALAPDAALQNGMQGLHNGAALRPHSVSPVYSPGRSGTEAVFGPPSQASAGFSAGEFAQFNASRAQGARIAGTAGPAYQEHAPMNAAAPSMGIMQQHSQSNPMMMYNPMPHTMSMPAYRQMHQETASLKGKERVVELSDKEWEEQFAKLELLEAEQQEQEQAKTDDQQAKQDDGEQNHGDFESIWRGIQAENETVESLMESLRKEQEKEGEDEWKVAEDVGDWNTFDESWNSWSQWNGGHDTSQEYTFEPENVFENQKNPFDEGMRIMREGGNLSLAALAFEAAVQKDPKHVDAWVQLGLAQAQNEKETAAIRALEHAVQLDPQNQQALMGLAVSYTNEAYESKSLQTLERWLHSKYPDIIGAPAEYNESWGRMPNREENYQRITNAFIKAAQRSPDGANMDPDVQVGLGVLFYGMEEYTKAVDCFEAALNSSIIGSSTQQEQVHLLWNRLGATLANSGDPERAIGAYQQALALRPHFVRARYNLGVSCIAMNCHEQAAQHLLAGLAMHKDIERSAREKVGELLGHDGQPVDERVVNDMMRHMNHSDTLIDTLRRTFVHMGRRDLADRVDIGVDPDIFRADFDF